MSKRYVKKSIVNFYDKWKTYDRDLVGDGYQAPQIIVQMLAPFLKNGARVVDLGCGSGLTGMYLRKKKRNCILTGTDISRGMLDQAKKKKVYHSLIEADLLKKLPFKDNSFEASMCVGVFEYFKFIKLPMREIARVTKSYCAFYVQITPNQSFYHHTKEEVLHAVEAAGMHVVAFTFFSTYWDNPAMCFVVKKGRSPLRRKAKALFYPAVPSSRPLKIVPWEGD